MIMSNFEEQYKEGFIYYCEYKESWVAKIGDTESKHKTPELCRKKIDSIVDVKPEFTRFEAIANNSDWDINIVNCTVTSVDHDEKKCWVVIGGKRKQLGLSSVFCNAPELVDQFKAASNDRKHKIDCAEVVFNAVVSDIKNKLKPIDWSNAGK